MMFYQLHEIGPASSRFSTNSYEKQRLWLLHEYFSNCLNPGRAQGFRSDKVAAFLEAYGACVWCWTKSGGGVGRPSAPLDFTLLFRHYRRLSVAAPFLQYLAYTLDMMEHVVGLHLDHEPHWHSFNLPVPIAKCDSTIPRFRYRF
jgi:hypothetical protein